MIDFAFIYLLIGCFITFMILNKTDELGITGDMVIDRFDYPVRIWLREHPNIYRLGLMIALFAIVFIWPYVLYKLMNEDE